MNHLIAREEVKKEDTWAVEDLFASEKEWERTLEKVVVLGDELSQYQGKLNSSMVLYEYLEKEDQMEQWLDDVYCYAMYCSDGDTANSHYQGLVDKVSSSAVRINTKLSFAEVEIMNIAQEEFESFFMENEKLKKYERALRELRKGKEHILSEKEESLLAAASEMASAPSSISNVLMNADITYSDAVDSEGKPHPLSNGTYISLLQSKDRILRESAFHNLYESYQQLKHTSAGILSAQLRQLKFYANARHFNTTLEAALFHTNVEPQVYPNLIQAVHEDIGYLHKYMRLRKKLMKVEELHMYDLYTPLLSECDLKIDFEEAKKNVLASLSVFGEEYQQIAERAFQERWIDKYENKGKRGGAYSSGSRVHPYLLLNYNNTLDSEFTLAHELGHAMHSYLSNHNQNYVDAHYVIFVAEVASTCNEALLMDYLRNHTSDKKVKAYLINYFLEQFRTTLYRQCLFAEFEWKVNEMCAANEPLNADTFSQLYYELNQFYYGEDVFVDEDIAYEWARIPHFYMNYYVYQYATGFSAAMALSRRLLNHEEGAVEDYLNFLKGGCSQYPIDLLKGAGVDMSSEKPIHEALSLFDQLLDEFEELMKEE